MNHTENLNRNDRPLITFALFAYNQEQFIAEAVQGAFSQTYSPLEIILSDDCSPDRTFEIMQEMAAAYQGPHTIVLNRNERNLGLVGHINRVMEMVKGELIVVAAGDDVSLPHRTLRIVQTYLDSGRKAFSIHSSVQKIDATGDELEELACYSIDERFSLSHMAEHTIGVMGNSHAWHRACFDRFGPINTQVMQEDVIIPFRAALLGEICSISEVLVLRRHHKNNIWLHPAKSTLREEVAWHQKHFLSRIDNLIGIWETKLADIAKLMPDQPEIVDELQVVLENRLAQNYLEREFQVANSIERIIMIPRIIESRVPMARLGRWVAQYQFSNIYYGIRKLERYSRSLLWQR